MANIKQVAKQAGVSVATVSRFLNNKDYVSQEAKAAIERAIKDLNYRPNQVARSLTTKQTNLIGLIVPDITNPFFPQLARAVEDTALALGYTVVLCNSDEQQEKELHYIAMLRQTYVAGFIVASNLISEQSYLDLNIPVVALDRSPESLLPNVSTNNFEAAKLGASYLIERGAKHLLCLRGTVDVASSNERVDGFLAAMTEEVDYEILIGDYGFDNAYKLMTTYLQQGKPVDGIFTCSDYAALGVLKAVKEAGLRVPEDIQIVGYDGIQLGELVPPGLTTVAQPVYNLGEQATRMLVNKLEGKDNPDTRIVLEASLCVRGTTK